MYFLGVLLVIVVFMSLVLHAFDISLSTFFPYGAGTPAAGSYPVPKGPALFSDRFLSDTYGWNLQSAPGQYSVTVGHGALTLQIEQPHLLWEPLPGERTYSNFLLTVNAMLSRADQNDGYGIYIRGTANQASDLATYYRFELYSDESYAIFKGTLDSQGHPISTRLVNYTVSTAIHPAGQLNHLVILAQGSALSLIVNGQLLKVLSDHSYASGSVALFVSKLSQAPRSAQVQFSQLAIYSVPA